MTTEERLAALPHPMVVALQANTLERALREAARQEALAPEERQVFDRVVELAWSVAVGGALPPAEERWVHRGKLNRWGGAGSDGPAAARGALARTCTVMLLSLQNPHRAASYTRQVVRECAEVCCGALQGGARQEVLEAESDCYTIGVDDLHEVRDLPVARDIFWHHPRDYRQRAEAQGLASAPATGEPAWQGLCGGQPVLGAKNGSHVIGLVSPAPEVRAGGERRAGVWRLDDRQLALEVEGAVDMAWSPGGSSLAVLRHRLEPRPGVPHHGGKARTDWTWTLERRAWPGGAREGAVAVEMGDTWPVELRFIKKYRGHVMRLDRRDEDGAAVTYVYWDAGLADREVPRPEIDALYRARPRRRA